MVLYPRGGVEVMLRDALRDRALVASEVLAALSADDADGRGVPASNAMLARQCLNRLATRFTALVNAASVRPKARCVASGGLSRSEAWLRLVSQAAGVHIERASHEHAGLLGIARIDRSA